MSHPWTHAESSVSLFGGKTEDYIALHSWFDDTKSWCSNWRHRAFRHQSEGIKECVDVFGQEIINSDGNAVSVYELGVQHVTEDVGFVPTPMDWFEHYDESSWNAFCEEKRGTKSIISSSTPFTIRDYIS